MQGEPYLHRIKSIEDCSYSVAYGCSIRGAKRRGDLAIKKLNKAIRYSRLTGEAGVRQRRRIRIRDNYTCQKCRIAVRVGEVDHIISLELGGTNEDSNMQLLCLDCHKKKTATDRGYVLKSGSSVDGTPTDSHHHWNKP